MEINHEARAARPRRRAQDTSDADSKPTSTTASATDSDAATETSSVDSPSTTGPAVTDSSGNDGPETITAYKTPPPWTATSSDAYQAPGVNATHPLTSSASIPTTTTTATTTAASSSSVYVDPAAAAAASAKAFGIPPNELTACQISETAGPFCTPMHLQDLWVGFTYSFHWNPDLFSLDATNTVELRYNDTSAGASVNDTVWTSDPIANIEGYVDVEMAKDWLLGASGNYSDLGQNITLYLNSQPAGGDKIVKNGPMISLVVDPATLPRVKVPPSPFVKKYGVEVGVPVGVVGLLLIILGICCGIRKNNRNHRNIKSMGKDYMAKRSRRRGKGGDIQLETYGDQDQYTDQPMKGGENAFRQEIARQREEDDRSLKRTVSSF